MTRCSTQLARLGIRRPALPGRSISRPLRSTAVRSSGSGRLDVGPPRRARGGRSRSRYRFLPGVGRTRGQSHTLAGAARGRPESCVLGVAPPGDDLGGPGHRRRQPQPGQPDVRRPGCRGGGLPLPSLTGEAYPYLWLDATYVKVREAGRVVSMACLVATGVAMNGERRVLGLELSPGNDEGSAWPRFIRSIVERGLHGVRLVISDDHPGLVKAVREQLLGIRAGSAAGSTSHATPRTSYRRAVVVGAAGPPAPLRLSSADSHSDSHSRAAGCIQTTVRCHETCVNSAFSRRAARVVEMRGLEPLTPAMRTQCSSS